MPYISWRQVVKQWTHAQLVTAWRKQALAVVLARIRVHKKKQIQVLQKNIFFCVWNCCHYRWLRCDLWQTKYWRYIILATNESWLIWGWGEGWNMMQPWLRSWHARKSLNPESTVAMGKAHWNYLNKYRKPYVMQRITSFNKWKRIINNSHWITSARNWIFCVQSIFQAKAVLVSDSIQ
jgi:hypothetical protein